MTTNLGFSSVAANQNQKEVTINDAFGQADAALTGLLTKTITDTNAGTVSTAEMKLASVIKVVPGSPTPTGAITLTFTAMVRGLFTIVNTTAQRVLATVSGQSAAVPSIPPGATCILIMSDSNVRYAADFQEIQHFSTGVPTVSVIWFRHIVARPLKLPVGAVGSQASVITNPSSVVTFDLQKNGVSVGSLAISTGGVPTFTVASAVSFAVGDRFDVVAPGDLYTLAGLALTIQFQR